MQFYKFFTISIAFALIGVCAGGYAEGDQQTMEAIDDRRGGTPLFSAIINDDVVLANKYISNNQYINQSRSDGITPLMLAAILKKNDLAKKLIDHGANINAVTTNGKYGSTVGMTALMYSAESGNPALTKVLISENSDVFLQNEKGRTALMYGVISGNIQTVQALCEAGAADYHVVDNQGYTADSIAALLGKDEIFKYLQKKNSEALAEQLLD